MHVFPDTGLDRMRSAHKVLMTTPFEPMQLDRGYANRTLRIDVGACKAETHPVSRQMKDLWTGGKGFDLWLMLKEVNEKTKWDSPQNPICFSSGPLGGTASFPGSGKTLVTAISPMTDSIIDCNVGGNFGPYLKWAGFDALVVTGRAEEDVIVLIDVTGRKITIEKAPLESVDSHVLAEELTAMYALDEDDKRNIAVVSAGRGAEHTRMGVLNFSFYDWRRQVARLKQAGRGGIGTVFRNKRIKALVIRCPDMTPKWTVAKSPVEKIFSDNICRSQLATVDLARIKMIMDKWNNDPEYVIEMMQDVQEQFRYLPKDALDAMSRGMKLSKGQFYHIATFYKSFSLKPLGETVIQVCMGTACHVKGAPRLLDAFERELGVKSGETTRDGKFTIDPVACLGCCSLAPVVKMGDDILGSVTTKTVPAILKERSAGGRK